MCHFITASTIDMDCDKGEYLCNKSRILGISDCISASYRCDGQLDCVDDSDEQGCGKREISVNISLQMIEI